jgi:hypothetical protein
MKKFKPGDKVVITDTARVYDTYHNMAIVMGLSNWKHGEKNDLSAEHTPNTVYTILTSSEVEISTHRYVYYGILAHYSAHLIINEEGLAPAPEKPSLKDEEEYSVGEKVMEYWSAATLDQKTFISKNFTMQGETTVGAVRKLRDMACAEWKPKIEENHKDIFSKPTDDKYFNLSILYPQKSSFCLRIFSENSSVEAGFESNGFFQIRSHGNYEGKGFYLDKKYNWEIIQDAEGGNDLVLIPTKK